MPQVLGQVRGTAWYSLLVSRQPPHDELIPTHVVSSAISLATLSIAESTHDNIVTALFGTVLTRLILSPL